MKSTTLRRASLSKEKIQVLQNIAKYRRQNTVDDIIPDIPAVKNELEPMQELDVLWNTFRIKNKQDKSPTVYLITGFILGAVTMLIIAVLIGVSMKTTNESAEDIASNISGTRVEDSSLTFIPADKEDKSSSTENKTASKEEVYSVQNGDTLESIIIRFYGSYNKKYEQAIKDANNMANPNSLSIGQKLIIPLN